MTRQVGYLLSALETEPLGQRGDLPAIASSALAFPLAFKLHLGMVLPPTSRFLSCCGLLFLFAFSALLVLPGGLLSSRGLCLCSLRPVSLFRLHFFSDPTWDFQGLLSYRMDALSCASANPALLLRLCREASLIQLSAAHVFALSRRSLPSFLRHQVPVVLLLKSWWIV